MNLSVNATLSQKEVEQIHSASLRVLERVGVAVAHPGLLERLEAAGAGIDARRQTASLPPKLVERCRRLAPATIALHSRNGKPPLEIGGGETRAVSGFDGTFFLDHDTGERRPIRKAEVGTFASLADRLPDISLVGVQGIPQDVPQDLAEAHAVAALLANTGKHLLIAPDTGRVATLVYDILKAATGREDLGNESVVSCHISPSAPLRWTPEACEVILTTVENGVPFYILPSPMAGATSPVTLAGYLVQHNAQILSGMVIAQVLRQGHPVVYCLAPTLFNMREGNPIIASPETMLLRVGGVQMARYYGIPCHTIGFDTDSHIVDQQYSWEKALTALAGIQSGVDVMVNLGMFSTGLTVSYESLLLDHEVFGFLKRYRRGIEVSPDHLAVEVIEKIGTWGSFLEEEHTARHFRSENWYPELSCRALFEPWSAAGARDLLAVAADRVRDMLAVERPSYLDRATQARIEAMITERSR
jgi:trimethylamine--corrinoid protein Co-methyltransferase